MEKLGSAGGRLFHGRNELPVPVSCGKAAVGTDQPQSGSPPPEVDQQVVTGERVQVSGTGSYGVYDMTGELVDKLNNNPIDLDYEVKFKELNQSKDYTDQGQTLEAFILDSAGLAILVKVANTAISEISETYKAKQLSTTFPLGPGHSYWKGLEDVRSIINFLKGDQIGISLTDSNLMLPKKSIAMVMGIGINLPDFNGKTHCDFCHLKGNCTMRNLSSNNC